MKVMRTPSSCLEKSIFAVDDAASARGLYQDYLKEEKNQSRAYNGLAMCDIFEKNYDNALNNIKKAWSVRTLRRRRVCCSMRSSYMNICWILRRQNQKWQNTWKNIRMI